DARHPLAVFGFNRLEERQRLGDMAVGRHHEVLVWVTRTRRAGPPLDARGTNAPRVLRDLGFGDRHRPPSSPLEGRCRHCGNRIISPSPVTRSSHTASTDMPISTAAGATSSTFPTTRTSGASSRL